MSLVPYALTRPFLFGLDPEHAHDLTLTALASIQRTPFARWIEQRRVRDPVTLAGLAFPNRVGLAAGLDKNGRCIDAFGAMGFGSIEVGTVTPLAQPGNPKPRMFRPRIPPLRRKPARRTFETNASRPSLLKPSRLISARASGRRNMRGFGLPGCASGVTVPTSMKPKPSAASPSMQRPFLSSPAARPTRFGKVRPASVTGSAMRRCAQAHCSGVFCKRASEPSVSSCACSGSRPKRNGRASE